MLITHTTSIPDPQEIYTSFQSTLYHDQNTKFLHFFTKITLENFLPLQMNPELYTFHKFKEKAAISFKEEGKSMKK